MSRKPGARCRLDFMESVHPHAVLVANQNATVAADGGRSGSSDDGVIVQAVQCVDADVPADYSTIPDLVGGRGKVVSQSTSSRNRGSCPMMSGMSTRVVMDRSESVVAPLLGRSGHAVAGVPQGLGAVGHESQGFGIRMTLVALFHRNRVTLRCARSGPHRWDSGHANEEFMPAAENRTLDRPDPKGVSLENAPS